MQTSLGPGSGFYLLLSSLLSLAPLLCILSHSVMSDALWSQGLNLPGSSVPGISRQEYWSRLPFPSPGIFQIQGSNPHLPYILDCRQIVYHGAFGSGKFCHFYNSKVPCFLSLHVSSHPTPAPGDHAPPFCLCGCNSPGPFVSVESHSM